MYGILDPIEMRVAGKTTYIVSARYLMLYVNVVVSVGI